MKFCGPSLQITTSRTSITSATTWHVLSELGQRFLACNEPVAFLRRIIFRLGTMQVC